MTPLHERLEPLSFLVGTWHGLGVVGYPTIEEQRYEQEVVFAHPTGIVEIYLGEVVFHKIELRSDVVARTDAATPKCLE